MEKLLPCPYCKSENVELVRTFFLSQFVVGCNVCGASSPVISMTGTWEKFGKEEIDLINQWNAIRNINDRN